MNVADYFASFRIKIDKASVKKVDTTLDRIENKLKLTGKNSKIKLNITGFTIDQSALRLALGTSLDAASNQVPFEISKFVVNDRNLLAALLRAARRLPPLPPGPNPPPYPPNPGPHPPGTRDRRDAFGGGLIGGGLSRMYGPALALGLGGYGLSQLNQRNQQVVSAQLQSSAVVQQAGGTAAQGADSFQYLRSEGQRIGFNYLDASQDYNKLISGLTGSGVGLQESQKVFSGFAELARVNKLDKTTQNRLFRALSQVAGKGKLQSEELVGQIAESLPGGTALFAQAYQSQLKATGKGKGDLTGQAAIQALLADMKKGIVTSDILTYAGATASERANAGGALGTASQASQAEQQRYQNTVNDLAVVASNAGVEEGFARIFRTLNAGLSESNGLVEGLAEGFNEATKWADDLLLWPQSFSRALDGKDSLVADWLGVDRTKELIQDWNQIKTIWGQLTDGPTPSWLPTLEATSKELAAVLKQGAEFAQWLKTLRDAPKNGAPEASFATQPITATWQALGRFGGGVSDSIQAAKTRGNAVYEDPSSPYYGDAARYDADMAAGTNRYKDLSKLQFDGLDSEISFKKDEELALTEELLRASLMKATTPNYDTKTFGVNNSSLLESSLGLYTSYPELTLSGAPVEDLSRYNSQTPSDIEDYNRQQALAQAESSVTNNVTNNFDVSINVDATLAGIEVEQQAQAMAEAFSTSLTGAFEQAQVNFPQK